MSDARAGSSPRWPVLLGAAALAAAAAALARAATAALPDLSAQATASVMAFGLALGVALFALRPPWHESAASERVLARAAAACALLLPMAVASWLALLALAKGAPAVWTALPLAPPFTAAGCAAAAVLARDHDHYRSALALGLLSAGLGAASALLLVEHAGLEPLLAAACGLAAIATLVLARAALLRGALLLALAGTLAAGALGPRLFAIPEQTAAPSGTLALRAAAGAHGLALVERDSGWDGHGRVQSFELIERGGRALGLGALTRDSARATPLLRGPAHDGLLATLCEHSLLARPLEAAAGGRVLLAGVGGGLELQCVLRRGARRVDIAEPSQAQLAAVLAFTGARLDRVHHHRVSARAFARAHSGAGYDLIVVPLSSRKHAAPSGVLPVAEALVHTDAGLRALLSLLAPGGRLFALVSGEPAALRFTITAEKALLALGAALPPAHVIVERAGDGHGVTVFRAPLEMQRVLAWHERTRQAEAAAEGEAQRPRARAVLEALLGWPLSPPSLAYTPGPAYANRFGTLFAFSGRAVPATRREAYAFDIAAAVDDRPLFWELTRRDRRDTWSTASALRVLPRLALTALLAALALVLLAAARMRPRPSLRIGLAFGSLGAAQVLGFAFAQHVLGLWSARPVHAFALSALALPALALPPLPRRIAARERPWAIAVQAAFAAAAGPLAPSLVLFSGHGAVAVTSVALLAVSAAAVWPFPRRFEQSTAVAASCLLFGVLAGGCASEVEPVSAPAAAPAGTTVVVLPDTQYYACAYPHIFERQARWIAEQREARGIALVLHTGDIVDYDIAAQWQVAEDSLAQLRGAVPFLLTSGNHDLSPGRASLFGAYFGPDELARYAWEAAARAPDRLDDSYAVVELGGRPWLFLGLEFGPRDASVQWAAEVLSAHAGLPAVLFTHAYLYSDGTRYDRTRAAAQLFHPDEYGFTPEQGIHDGEDLWRTLVEPYENVRLVVSGHVVPDGTARAASRRASGSVVHELLANYQTCDVCPCAEVEGGGGYLRLLSFGATSIRVTTYSPHLDRWLTDAENEFVLELE